MSAKTCHRLLLMCLSSLLKGAVSAASHGLEPGTTLQGLCLARLGEERSPLPSPAAAAFRLLAGPHAEQADSSDTCIALQSLKCFHGQFYFVVLIIFLQRFVILGLPLPREGPGTVLVISDLPKTGLHAVGVLLWAQQNHSVLDKTISIGHLYPLPPSSWCSPFLEWPQSSSPLETSPSCP